MQIESISEYKKKRYKVLLDNGTVWNLYAADLRTCQLKQGMYLSDELFDRIEIEVLEKRAVKRAMHLLEKKDWTEKKLRDKLMESEYPEKAIDAAIAYVTGYHYLDDLRYAQNFVRAYQDTRSRKRITMDLLAKGVAKSWIEQAFADTYEADEQQMIRRLLEKKNYHFGIADDSERRKVYAFLLRRGFRSEDVLRAMKCSDYLT